MTLVSEAYTWAAYSGELKTWLGIADASEDTELELWWSAALQEADTYIDKDFVDDDEEDIDITTSSYRTIKLGLFEWVKRYRAAMQGGSAERDPTLKSVKTDDLTETYSDPSELIPAVTRAVSSFWWPFKAVIFY